MTQTIKTLTTLFIGILLALSVKNASAQYPGMNRVYANMNRQFANQQMNMMMANMRYGNYYYNNKYTFYVVLKDSSQKEVTSKIYTDTTLHKSYLLLVDKKYPKSDTAHRYQKIYADQTSNIYRVDNSGFSEKPVTIRGIANDSCWMFKAISGPITVYSLLSEPDGYNFDPSTIIGIQLKDGPIVKFTADNLKQMICQNDARALEIAENKNYLKAIKKYNRDMEKAVKK